ncbi:hypothetical protein M3C58_00375 [Brachybacterium muris]|uniref:hypothetical protein n=1 Tax=Brachybacterium muris TaxID=219301 RepID=UPI0021A31BC5|nr:hypothetical protein [Brachybacterium muris]MCT1996673.1 hypothetical protein [Brachybacterium muris]
MSIKIIMHDGETITVPGEAKDVKINSNVLTITRNNIVTAQFRRYIAWIEQDDTTNDGIK